MKKFTALVIALLIIGIISGIQFFRSEKETTLTQSPENHFKKLLEMSETSQQLASNTGSTEDNAQSEFQDDLDREFKKLPTIDDLQQLTEEEVHYTPEVIKEAGGVIGRIHDEAENDPTKRVAAMQFFKQCAEDQQMVPAIRAVCLKKILKLVPVWQIPMPLSDKLISQEITDLVAKLP